MCEKVIDYYDTANNPIYKIKCDCGTTVCQKINHNFVKQVDKDFNDEQILLEEKEFYRKHTLISK